MSNNITGNKISSFNLMSVLMALKENIARDFHVADVCKIIEKKNDGYYVSLYNDTSVKFQCRTVIETELNKDDVVLVVYTNSNFKNKNAKPLHSRNNAVIVSQTGGGGGSAIEVIDNLLSNSPSAALSANQGRVLKGLIDSLNSNLSSLNSSVSSLNSEISSLKSETSDLSNSVSSLDERVTEIEQSGSGEFVAYTPQTLSAAQQQQARTNISASKTIWRKWS